MGVFMVFICKDVMRYLPVAWLAFLALAVPVDTVAASTTVVGVRTWAAPDHTRVVLDLTGVVSYKYFQLEHPRRLVVDLAGATMADVELPSIVSRDLFLKRLRHGSYKGALRLVLDLKADISPDIFVLEPHQQHGHRLVIDLLESQQKVSQVKQVALTSPPLPGAGVKVPVGGGSTPSSPLGSTGDSKAVSPPPEPAICPPDIRGIGVDDSGSGSTVPGISPPLRDGATVTPPLDAAVSRHGGGHQPSLPLDSDGAGAVPPELRLQICPPGDDRDGNYIGVSGPLPGDAVPGAAPSPPLRVPGGAVPGAGSGGTGSTGAAVITPPSGSVKQPVATVDQGVERGVAGREIVVAVDAGHGGDDPGAIGKSHGTHEKDIVLKVSKVLADMINAEPGMKAVLTREHDYFVTLGSRVRKARVSGADIFISIHADSYKDSSVRGSSVYILSQKRATSEHARWLANKENKSDLVGGVNIASRDDLLASVLLDLSQTAALQASAEVARDILHSMGKVSQLHKKQVEAASFMVLSAPDIPSVLIETGFISNPGDEVKLRDSEYRGNIARAIFEGLRTYFKRRHPGYDSIARGES